ncbi:MAG: radical SAM protein [Halobacteriota archaeon]|nr:radical SAM protein [Halobacteriota archaeon]
MTGTKFLLINAIDGHIELDFTLPHLGLGYIASYVRDNLDSIDVRIIDGDFKREILSFRPDLVGITSVSQNFGIARNIASLCEGEDIPVIIGGPHISALPSQLSPGMDVGVIGEGERTVLEIIRFFEEHGMDFGKIGDIDGIVYRDDGELKVTDTRKLIDPLDTIPLPARDLLNIRRGDRLHMFSSRGCPFRCRFCSSSRFWGSVRFFSAGYVLDEIRYMIDKYHPPHIAFSDDLIIANKRRLREIADMIDEEGIGDEVSFSLKCRANLVNEEVVRLLKKMNVIEVGIGLESGSQKILNYLKDGTTVEDNRTAIDLIKRYDILLSPTFILGSPSETKEDALETLDFIRRSKMDQFNFFTLIPLPGTPVWDYAKERGLVSDDMDWSKLSLAPNSLSFDGVVLSEEMSEEELIEVYSSFERERKKRYHGYVIRKGLKHPNQVIPFLRKKVAFRLGCES